MKIKETLLSLCIACCPLTLVGQNQTDALSPIYPEDSLPFTLEIEQASFGLPTGLQAYSSAIYKGKWIFIGGRTNGLHGFDNLGNNFPPRFQNTTIYIVDPCSGKFHSRSLSESGLSQIAIDDLSSTAGQNFQKGHLLYICGGYGLDTLTNTMGTRDSLTEIDLDILLEWVKHGEPHLTCAIRQVRHPLLQVCGGELFQASDSDPFLLMVGQNFIGDYRDNSNGIYTQQIRRFRLHDDGSHLSLVDLTFPGTFPDYRRRDLNIVPIILRNQPAYVILSGVFTLQTGVWTVPITVFRDGMSIELIPTLPSTFKQGMNNYNCPSFSLYSQKTKDMFLILPGGISFGYFQNGTFQTDSEIPFINQVTTIKLDKEGNYTQYLMNGEYPFIASTGTNPGNALLFGAEAVFFPAEDIAAYPNGVLNLDKIKGSKIIGYIAGGIMSTLANTNTREDSTSSPYVFTVKLTKR